MTYDVRVAQVAVKDIENAMNYIEFTLLNPSAADSLYDEITQKIGELSSFPKKQALVDDPVLKAAGIGFVVIKNYLAFYRISEDSHKVTVIRFLYNKRTWQAVLKAGL